MSADNRFSRRSVLGLALASASTAAFSKQAMAETAIDRILNATNRDSWNDSFDATAPTKAKVVTSTPIFAPQTIDSVQQAIAEYSNIVANGGWPRVPSDKKLELGVSSPAVRALRQRLMISGDLPRGAGTSEQFDS
mgnify:FL=1